MKESTSSGYLKTLKNLQVFMKDPAVLSRFFARFFDFKTCFQVGARGGYQKNYYFPLQFRGQGFQKMGTAGYILI
jgi:hypothetical protein